MMKREFDARTADTFDFGDLLPGACYPLPSGSDSRAFMYVGEPDAHGEYPVLLVDTDDVPFLCVEYPGLDVYFGATFGAIRLAGGSYASAFDDRVHGAAMVDAARRTLRGLKFIDLGGDSEHVDGPDALEATLSTLFGEMGDAGGEHDEYES